MTTVPDSTSQKFMIVGQISRRDQKSDDQRYAVVSVDFTNTRSRKCGENDFESWYARAHEQECLMGHKVRCAGASHDDLAHGGSVAMVQAAQGRCGLLRRRRIH